MTEISLTKSHRIGASYYTEFNTVNLPIRTLLAMIKNLPATEEDSKTKIHYAINNGQYKRDKQTIYFVPPVSYQDEIVTHIIPSKITTENLCELLKITEQHNKCNTTINKLKKEITKRNQKNESAKRERDDSTQEFYRSIEGQKHLPIKKRNKII